MGEIVLVTGGARSGKSTFALDHAKNKYGSRTFIATAVVIDDEMKQRVDIHRSERGSDWVTIESPYELSKTIENLKADSIAVIDCLTVWLGNIWFKYGSSDKTLSSQIDLLISSVTFWKNKSSGTLVFVTNEVGWGIIPADAATRLYRDWAGKLNQQIAKIANEVFLCVAGLPVKIK